MKRFVSMLLTLCLLCSMAVPGAFAQDVSIPTVDSAEAPLGEELSVYISEPEEAPDGLHRYFRTERASGGVNIEAVVTLKERA